MSGNSEQAAWTPDSWKTKPIKQDVVYDNPEELSTVLTRITNMPPLVSATEID
ncbi:hypothetical protein H4S03_009453, partial [Coemansia sp. S3946]